MKKNSTTLLFCLLLLVLIGCSSTPEGTVAIKDLQKNIEQQIGQKVVVVGTADTSASGMSTTGLFRLYKGNEAVWVSVPERGSAPPQGVRIRVTGVIAENTFSGGIGRRVYVDLESITME
jgi:hypothetical protein